MQFEEKPIQIPLKPALAHTKLNFQRRFSNDENRHAEINVKEKFL
ncbi:MAG TPA: hypothetical protein VGM58_05120 [Verrucomicrobiae bacterium]